MKEVMTGNKKQKCTECGQYKYIIVAEGDGDGFHHSKGKGKVKICDRCFNLLEGGEDNESFYCLQ